MNIKKVFVLILRILALAVIGIIISVISSRVTPQPEIVKAASGGSTGQTLLLLFIYRLVVALVFAYLLENTSLRGIRLAGLLFWVTFGISTFMMEIETVIFGSAFPGLSTVDVLRLVFTAFVNAILFVPLSVLVMGRWKNNGTTIRPLFKNDYLPGIAVLAVIYPMLYFFFGYVIAWQSPAVREFYATTTITNAQPLLTLIQIGRGALWVIAGLPLLVMLEKRSHIVIASILCYSLLSSFALILPNPLMPEPVRMAHLVEISLSMAIFGALIGWIMTQPAMKKNEKSTALLEFE